MRKLLLLLFLTPIVLFPQSPDQNYIKTITYKKPTTSGNIDVTNPANAIIHITYFDGLGRPIQQVAHKQSNSGKDIVTHIEYDAFGRQIKEYLPYVNQTPSLNYNPSAQADVMNFYASPSLATTGNPSFEATTNPFIHKELEASPLSRVLKQTSQGNPWAMGSGKEIKFDYQTNEENEVKLFKATTTWNATTQLYDIAISSPQPYYNPSQLYKTITKDENWTSGLNNTTEEFKDKEGKIVLKRTYNVNHKGNTEAYDTYYVYDIYGNLTYVLPPLAEGNSSQTTLDNLGYQYKYDYRNRLVEKKLPGKQWEFIIYDKQNRPVATAPAFSPYGGTATGWLINEYDVFGRVIQTGWKQMTTTANDRATNQSSVTAGNNPFVLSANDILTKKYYDNYTFSNAPQVPAQIEGQDTTTSLKGMPTGSWTKVLDANNPNAFELSYTIYDDRYRPVRTYTSNHLGGYTQVDSKLDWIGKTEYTITTHKYDTNSTVLIVKDIFEYTDQDRLNLHKQQINGGTEQLIAKNNYDELGQLISKNVGGQDVTGATGLQTVDYNYNIRGWLKNINDVNNIGNDLFSFKINYNDPENATALYNGNISETFWNTSSDNIKRKYEYSYDNLNRLLKADYVKAGNTNFNSYLEQLTYDKNGNIQSLLRNGDSDTDGSQLVNEIDNLIYTYDTNIKNQLVKVVDNSISPQGFKDDTDSNNPNNINNDYLYDANGNMTKDENKGITNIEYNHLNLPTKILVGTNTIEYLYNATGQKVSKIVTEASIVNKTDYLAGGFQYKNSVLQFFPHPEGYVNVIDSQGISNFNYVFNYTDHLGNIRLSYGVDPSNGTLKTIEENHYYPFGLKHTNYNSDLLLYTKGTSGSITLKKTAPSAIPNYFYKFLGQERQNELGLNWDTFRHRNYDYAIGRFMGIDPISEEYFTLTNYQFAHNNPVWKIEIEGLEGTPSNKAVDVVNNEPVQVYHYEVNGKKMIMEVYVTDNLSNIDRNFNDNNEYVDGNGNAGNMVTYDPFFEPGKGVFNVDATDGMLIAHDIYQAYDLASGVGAFAVAGKKLLKEGIGEAIKKIPNPFGKKGGKAHQEKVTESIEKLKEEGFDLIETEVMVKTPNGSKGKRFIDARGTNSKTGKTKDVQVGRKNKKRGDPVSRERKALDDIEGATGNRPDFVPYNE